MTTINTSVQSQLNSAYIADCSTINILLDQRRKLKFFNTPPPRYTPISPYPQYTSEQLNMRRKIEILKYNNSVQNTKTNNLTKKETYALLARGSGNQYSQTTIQQAIVNPMDLSACVVNDTKPTWSTACGIPGKPFILQYDPNVPLYNYINDATQDANYATAPDTDTTIVKMYTLNQLEYLYLQQKILAPDSTNNVDYGNNINRQTRTLPVGNIVNTKFLKPQLLSYNLSIPIGIWMIGVKGFGIIDPSCNNNPQKQHYHIDPSYGVLQYDNSCYKKFPGKFVIDPTDSNYPKPPPDPSKPQIIPQLKFSIDSNTTPVLSIQYSGQSVTPIATPTFSSSFNSNYVKLNDVSFIPHDTNYQFYGIQYVGNLMIHNLVLDVQPEEVYDMSLTMNYSYDYAISQQFDMFQTGLFFNLSRENINVADGMRFLGDPPNYLDFSYNVVSTSNIPIKFNFFDYGTNIPQNSPAITNFQIQNIGTTSISLYNITGNYTYYDITRIYVGSSGASTYTYTTHQTTSTYTDNDLIPNSTYIFKITPVLNHMTGSITPIGQFKTGSIDISGVIGEVSFYQIEIKNIKGVYSYYSLSRYEQIPGQNTLDVSFLQTSTYVDTNLNPGKNYYYTLTPHLLSQSGNVYDGSSISLNAKTFITNITSARISLVTSNSVLIVDISGNFKTFSVVRNGITPGAVSIAQTDISYSSFYKDENSKLVSGYTYDYYLIPSVYNSDTGKYIDGPSFHVGNTTIP